MLADPLEIRARHRMNNMNPEVRVTEGSGNSIIEASTDCQARRAFLIAKSLRRVPKGQNHTGHRVSRKQSTHPRDMLILTRVSSSLLALGNGFRHPVPEPVPFARHPEEPGAVIPHAGICEGGAG